MHSLSQNETAVNDGIVRQPNEVYSFQQNNNSNKYIPNRQDISPCSSSTNHHHISADEAAPHQKWFAEQRRAAIALAQMLNAYGGLSALSTLSSRERTELAAKVNAIQHQVVQGTALNDNAHLVTQLGKSITKRQPEPSMSAIEATATTQSGVSMTARNIAAQFESADIKQPLPPPGTSSPVNYLSQPDYSRTSETMRGNLTSAQLLQQLLQEQPPMASVLNQMVPRQPSVSTTDVSSSYLTGRTGDPYILQWLKAVETQAGPGRKRRNVAGVPNNTMPPQLGDWSCEDGIKVDPTGSYEPVSTSQPNATISADSLLPEIVEHQEELKKEIHSSLTRACKRRRESLQHAGCVETLVWKRRRQKFEEATRNCTSEQENETLIRSRPQNEEKVAASSLNKATLDQKANAENNLAQFVMNVPVWSGSRFLHLPDALEERDINPNELSIPIAAWWTEVFSNSKSDDNTDDSVIAAADSVNADVLTRFSAQEEDSIRAITTEDTGSTKNFISTVNGSLDTPIDSYYFRRAHILVSQLYPPSIQQGKIIGHPTHDIPCGEAEEMAYAMCPSSHDRFLQEILRGKFHRMSDLTRPIPQILLDKARGYRNDQQMMTVTQTSTTAAAAKKPAGGNNAAGRWRPTALEDIGERNVTSGLRRSQREGIRSRGSYTAAGRYGFGGQYGTVTSSDAIDNALHSSVVSSPSKKEIAVASKGSVNLAASFMDAVPTRAVSTQRLTTTSCSAAPNVAESDFDIIKRASGWHPYVWYLMCRRPELYGIGIRARLVARVAGWEWDEIQKSPEPLHAFLSRIYSFLERNPVPRAADKKEAKEYKHFAANSVRTPWYQLETPAIRRALRDIEAGVASPNRMAGPLGGVDSDSGPSDGGSSEPLTPLGASEQRTSHSSSQPLTPHSGSEQLSVSRSSPAPSIPATPPPFTADVVESRGVGIPDTGLLFPPTTESVERQSFYSVHKSPTPDIPSGITADYAEVFPEFSTDNEDDIAR